MSDPEALYVELGDGYVVEVRGPAREGRQGPIMADTSLSNGRVLHSDRIALSTDEGRRAWAIVAANRAPFDADLLADVLLQLSKPAAEQCRRRAPAPPLDPVPEDDERPTVDVGHPDLSVLIPSLWEAVAATNNPPVLFQFGGLPARLVSGAEGLRTEELTPIRLRGEVGRRVCCFERRKRGERVDTVLARPPEDVMRVALAAPDLPLPPLTGIVTAPIFGPDGTLNLMPGYQASSGLYYAPPPGLLVPPVPATPSRQDIAHARALLRDDLLGDFPFATDADRAHAVALLLLSFVREMIDGPTPLHLIESPTPGTGKGLLAEVCLRPGVGRPDLMPQATDDEEWRKRVTAALLGGAGVLFMDNVTTMLDSGVLAAALTMTTWTDRLLGSSKTVTVRNRAIWIVTANNPMLSMELARRSIRIRLTRAAERPWELAPGRFRHPDLRAWTAEHRGALIGAALTLIQAWIAAGRPAPTYRALGSFEAWTRVVGGVLELAGIPGFLANLDELYDRADVEGTAWRRLVALWWEQFGSKDVGTAELFPLADKVDELDVRGKDEKAQRVSFGRRLRAQQDRIYSGFRIASVGKQQRAGRWRLEPITLADGEGREGCEGREAAPGSKRTVSPVSNHDFGAGPGPEPSPTFTTFTEQNLQDRLDLAYVEELRRMEG